MNQHHPQLLHISYIIIKIMCLANKHCLNTDLDPWWLGYILLMMFLLATIPDHSKSFTSLPLPLLPLIFSVIGCAPIPLFYHYLFRHWVCSNTSLTPLIFSVTGCVLFLLYDQRTLFCLFLMTNYIKDFSSSDLQHLLGIFCS